MVLEVVARLISRSPEGTEVLGALLGRLAPAGTVLALEGDLGSGKTCLVRGLARGLGLEGPVGSPSYTLLQTHEGGRLPLHHFDAWMEGRQKALLEDGAAEWLYGDGIAAVEWAERLEAWLPDPHLVIQLFHRGIEERELVLGVRGEAPEPLRALAQWLTQLSEALPERPDLSPLGLENP